MVGAFAALLGAVRVAYTCPCLPFWFLWVPVNNRYIHTDFTKTTSKSLPVEYVKKYSIILLK